MHIGCTVSEYICIPAGEVIVTSEIGRLRRPVESGVEVADTVTKVSYAERITAHQDTPETEKRTYGCCGVDLEIWRCWFGE